MFLEMRESRYFYRKEKRKKENKEDEKKDEEDKNWTAGIILKK
jgi:hypothetical protein